MFLKIVKDALRGGVAGNTVPSPPAAGETPHSFVRDPSRPSVLVLTHTYHGNGAAEMLTYVLHWLTMEKGWQVHALARDLKPQDIDVLNLCGVDTVNHIDPAQYDFAFLNTLVSGSTFIVELAGELPAILWAHEGEAAIWNCSWSVGDWKRVFSGAAHLIFQTRWQAERIFGSFTSHLLPSRYSCLTNCLLPVPSDLVAQPPRPGKKRVVFIGSLCQRKRPTDLVEAVLQLNRDDVECVFVGPKEHLAEHSDHHREALVKDSRFVVTGALSREAAMSWLASADVFCLPSADESQPLVLLEAAHFGVPIIVSDLPVYRDIWTHGQNCLMHAVGGIGALVEHLSAAMDGRAPKPVLPSSLETSEAAFQASLERIFDGILAPSTADSPR